MGKSFELDYVEEIALIVQMTFVKYVLKITNQNYLQGFIFKDLLTSLNFIILVRTSDRYQDIQLFFHLFTKVWSL